MKYYQLRKQYNISKISKAVASTILTKILNNQIKALIHLYLSNFHQLLFKLSLGACLSPPQNTLVLFGININRLLCHLEAQRHSGMLHSEKRRITLTITKICQTIPHSRKLSKVKDLYSGINRLVSVKFINPPKGKLHWCNKSKQPYRAEVIFIIIIITIVIVIWLL